MRTPPSTDKLGFDYFFEKVMRNAGAGERQFNWSLFDQLAGERTAQPLNLYVDPVNGDDIRGDGSGTKPYKTITAAVTAIPMICTQPVTINLAAGTCAGEFRVSAIAIAPITIQGPALALATLTSGLQTGTVASIGTGADPNPRTWTVTGAGWTAGNLKGKFFQVTSGTSSGKIYAIANNTSTTVELASTDSNIVANTFAIVAPQTTITRASTDTTSSVYQSSHITSGTDYTDTRLIYFSVPGFTDNGLIIKNVTIDLTVNNGNILCDGTGEILFDTCIIKTNTSQYNSFAGQVDKFALYHCYVLGNVSPDSNFLEARFNGTVVDTSTLFYDCIDSPGGFSIPVRKASITFYGDPVVLLCGKDATALGLFDSTDVRIFGQLCLEGNSGPSSQAIWVNGTGITISGGGTVNISAGLGSFVWGINIIPDSGIGRGQNNVYIHTLNVVSGSCATGIGIMSSQNYVEVAAGEIEGCTNYGVNMADSSAGASYETLSTFNTVSLNHGMTFSGNGHDVTLDGTTSTAHTLASIHSATNSRFAETTVPTYNVVYSP